MFNKTKPIVLGETYIFDVLGESDLSQTTSLVTVIKKAKKRKTYTVMSVNTKEVFDCPQGLLTPYSEDVKIVRCQFGTTDFDEADLEFLNGLDNMFTLMKNMTKAILDNVDPSDDDKSEDIVKTSERFKETVDCLTRYNVLFTKKIQRYYDIAQYKYNLANTIRNPRKIEEKSEEPTIIKSEPHIKYNRVDDTEFRERMDAAVYSFLRGTMSFDEFKNTVVNIIEESIPDEVNLSIDNDVQETITKKDLRFMLNAIISELEQGAIIFLAAKTEDGKVKATCLTQNDMYNKNELMAKFVRYVRSIYPKWGSEQEEYQSNRKIGIIRFNFNGIDEEDDD